MNDPHPATQAVTVRPKQQSALTQRDIRSVLNSSQAQTTQVDHDDQQTGYESYCEHHAKKGSLQNLASALPTRNIPVFDGNPLQFQSY